MAFVLSAAVAWSSFVLLSCVNGAFTASSTGILCPGVKLYPNPLSSPMLKITCHNVKGCSGFACDGVSPLVNVSIFSFGLHVDACDSPITGKVHFRNKYATLRDGDEFSLVDGTVTHSDTPSTGDYLRFDATRQGNDVTAKVTANVLTSLIGEQKSVTLFAEHANVTELKCNATASSAPVSSTVSVPGKTQTASPTPPIKTTLTTRHSAPATPAGTTASPAVVMPSGSTAVVASSPSSRAVAASSPHSRRHSSIAPTKPSSTAHASATVKPTKHPHGHGGKGGLSRTVKILIFVGIVFFVVSCVVLVFYCRRLKRQRPSYYNDIAINDPLRDDYDGDDDDAQPLFNAHLVL